MSWRLFLGFPILSGLFYSNLETITPIEELLGHVSFARLSDRPELTVFVLHLALSQSRKWDSGWVFSRPQLEDDMDTFKLRILVWHLRRKEAGRCHCLRVTQSERL